MTVAAIVEVLVRTAADVAERHVARPAAVTLGLPPEVSREEIAEEVARLLGERFGSPVEVSWVHDGRMHRVVSVEFANDG